MAGPLESVVRTMLDAFAKQDVSLATDNTTDDVQGIDEISRRWMRGSGEMKKYLEQLVGLVSDVSSDLVDVRETINGDVGVLTCMLEQSYTLEGNTMSITAPTTVVLRREGGAWKAALFHSVPLADQ